MSEKDIAFEVTFHFLSNAENSMKIFWQCIRLSIHPHWLDTAWHTKPARQLDGQKESEKYFFRIPPHRTLANLHQTDIVCDGNCCTLKLFKDLTSSFGSRAYERFGGRSELWKSPVLFINTSFIHCTKF